MLTYVTGSAFHDRPLGEYPTLAAAQKEARRHAKECACGAGVHVRGTRADLEAAGAYETQDGELCIDPGGDDYLICEITPTSAYLYCSYLTDNGNVVDLTGESLADLAAQLVEDEYESASHLAVRDEPGFLKGWVGTYRKNDLLLPYWRAA